MCSMDKQLREIRDWWTTHSQGYQSDHKKEFRSPDLMKLNDFDFKLYIAGIDKEFGGSPLSKYISKYEVIDMFAPMKLKFNMGYEQKTFATLLVPSSLRKRDDSLITNNLYTRLFGKLGFLGYYVFEYE